MAVDGTPYLEALVAARDRGRVITRQTHDHIMQSMFRSLRDLTASEGAGAITPERAEALRRQFASLMESFEDGFALATERGIDLTIDDISSLHDRALSRMSEAAGVPIRSSFEGIDDLVYSNLAIRRGSDSFVSLMDYRLNGAMREFDTMLTAAVSRGVPSGQITMDLAQVMASNDPALQQALSRLPRGFRAARVGGLASVDFSRYGIDEKDVQQLRTLLYDARRIGVSETNNALREANGIAMQSSPVVEAARWQTSGRHEGLPSSPDACDVYQYQDLYGLGGGMYPPEFWPFGPHSYCGCYQGGPMRFRNPSEWNKPRPEPPPRRIDPDDTGVMKALTQGMTPGKARQVREQVRINTRLTESKVTARLAEQAAARAAATAAGADLDRTGERLPLSRDEADRGARFVGRDAEGPYDEANLLEEYKKEYLPVQAEIWRRDPDKMLQFATQHEEVLTRNLRYSKKRFKRLLDEAVAQGSVPAEALEELSELVADGALIQWNWTSGDSDAIAVALQRAFRDELGIDGADMAHLASVSAEATSVYDQFGDVFRQMVRTQYEMTQRQLAAEGIEYVTLVRGARWADGDSTPDWVDAGRDWQVNDIGGQPASSWTPDARSAAGFALRGYDRSQHLFVTRVPAAQILGTPRAGMGHVSLREFIVRGDPRRTIRVSMEVFKEEGIQAFSSADDLWDWLAEHADDLGAAIE